jgi:hypothetical protein
MSRFFIVLLTLSSFLSACSLNLPKMVEAKFKHKNDVAFEASVASLEAEGVNLAAETSQVNDSTQTFLNLTIVNPKAYSGHPERMISHTKELARMLVADLKNPQDFDAVRVEVQVNHDYLVASTHNSQTAEYTIAELQ